MTKKESELIKEKLDIAEFLRSYINLSPAGRNFKGLCPFHQEKTPSFMVSPDRKMWHCFGCGEGGDIISFVMKYEHVEFPEALRMLAERAGIPMRTLSPTQEREFGILYDLHEAANEFFVRELEKNPTAKQYLTNRKLSDETIREFGIGWNPPGDALTLFLMGKRFDIRDIYRAGLVYKAKGLNRDRFENRIIFPLHNSLGKIVGFAGRILPLPGQQIDESAKYLNSPETPIFTKSKVLYGLHRSKMKISESRSAFIVEGYMDFLMSWQSGVQNTVATSGTALTQDHLERLRRFADTVFLSFDNDAAGLRALERAVDMFHEYDFHIKAVDLGNYKDPAEAAEHDPKFLSEALKKSSPAFEYIFRKYFSPETDTEMDIALTKRVISYLLQKIKKIKSVVEQGIWVKRLARVSDTSETALLEELDAIELKKGQSAEKTGDRKPTSRFDLLAERLLIFGFAKPEFMSMIKEKKEIFPPIFRKMMEEEEGDQAEMFRMRASYDFGGKPTEEVKREFDETLRYLELEHLLEQQAALQKNMRRMKPDEDDEKYAKIVSEFSAVSRAIDALKRKGLYIQTKNDEKK